MFRKVSYKYDLSKLQRENHGTVKEGEKKWDSSSLDRIARSRVENQRQIDSDASTARSRSCATGRKFADVSTGTVVSDQADTVDFDGESEWHTEGRPDPSDYEFSGLAWMDSNVTLDTETLTDSEPEEDPVCEIERPTGFRLIDMEQLSGLVNAAAVCRGCGGDLQLKEDPSRRRGWASCLALECTNIDCNISPQWKWTSKACDSGARVVNKLSVISMRAIGKGRRGAATFASHLNLPAPVDNKSWMRHTKAWGDTADDILQDEIGRASCRERV